MSSSVPIYELYGEILSNTEIEALHHETIGERSSKYDWTIRPHCHLKLAQIFLFNTPGITIQWEREYFTSVDPMIMVVPANVVHGFRFPDYVRGDVLSLQTDALSPPDMKRLEFIGRQNPYQYVEGAAPRFHATAELIAQLAGAYTTISEGRSNIMSMLTSLILSYLTEDAHDLRQGQLLDATHVPSRHQAQAERFFNVLESSFSTAKTNADYAREVGVSTPHLNRICNSILGATPNQLIRRRRVLEAKRLLRYTRLSAAEIAVRVGIGEPGYFNRIFKAATGYTPLSFRRLSDGSQQMENDHTSSDPS